MRSAHTEVSKSLYNGLTGISTGERWAPDEARVDDQGGAQLRDREPVVWRDRATDAGDSYTARDEAVTVFGGGVDFLELLSAPADGVREAEPQGCLSGLSISGHGDYCAATLRRHVTV